MPRRLLIVLFFVFATLSSPNQQALGQVECPEGGCRVFLPVVHKPVYATVVLEYVNAAYYCVANSVVVTVTNVVDMPITSVKLRGALTGLGYSGTTETVPFSLTSDDVLFPGETSRFDIRVGACRGGPYTGDVNVVDAVPMPNAHIVEIVSRELVQTSVCEGGYTYQLFGVIRNSGQTTLSQVKVFLPWGRNREYADVERSTLAPGESTQFSKVFHVIDDPHTECSQEPYTVPQDRFVVHSWGERVP